MLAKLKALKDKLLDALDRGEQAVTDHPRVALAFALFGLYHMGGKAVLFALSFLTQ